jgi:magnesium transporter
MLKSLRRRSKKAGLPPGTPVHVGEKKSEKIKITIIDYDKDKFEIREAETVEECSTYKDKPTVTWINIDGLHEVSFVENIGKCFDIHPLIIEDILNTEQRPKIDIFDNYIFIVLKMHIWDEKSKEIKVEQISLIFGNEFVLTFQEMQGDVFDVVRERIKNGKGKIRGLQADYLAYVLIDAVVDNYFKVLENVGDEIENIEEELLANPTPQTLNKIHVLKREMIYLRKSVWPLREIISKVEREESSLIQDSTNIYLRDLYDHTIQIIDTVETFGDVISGMLDVYLSSVSNRLNEIMKILTTFAAIFIPLTFIAGIYGMNFNTQLSPLNMPELNWYYGYPFVLGIMAVLGISMFFYFRKKRWV